MAKKFDLFKSIDKIITKIPVSEIMVRKIKVVDQEDNAQKVTELMAKHSISGLIVCDENKDPVGIVSEGDLLKKVFHKKKDPTKVKIKEIMSKELITIKPSYSIGRTSTLMKKRNVSKFPVVEKGDVVGYVTKSDLLEKLNEIYEQNRRFALLAVLVIIQMIIIGILLISLIAK